MKIHLLRHAVLAIALLVPSFSTVAATAATATGERPQLVVTTLDGKTFDLAAERGKWVVVNFWATWCSPCIAEMPAISRYVSSHPDVTAIGLAYEDTSHKEVLAFARKHPVDYPLAQLDPPRPPPGFETLQNLPTTYLIAPDGRLVKHFVGPIDGEALEAAIEAAGGHTGAAAPKS